VKALKNREMAIEAMKRKIEARMRGQGQEGLAQQIAVRIVDRTGISPTAESPETTRENPTPTEATTSDTTSQPIIPEDRENSDSKMVDATTSDPTSSPDSEDIHHVETAMIDVDATIDTTPMKLDTPQPDLEDPVPVEDDEENSLLAELEAERLAEEAARKKRRDLEDRLANARGRKTFRSTSAMSEREGSHKGNVIVVQDIGPKRERMVIEPVIDDGEITLLDHVDPIVVDDIPMDEVDTQTPKDPPTLEVKDPAFLYKSPLRIFTSFRFHPLYLTFVPFGGYRSLTYSHHINPTTELCRFELSGGICNDTSCNYQHFKTIILSDAEILKDLVKVVVGENPWSDQNFVRGDLRQRMKIVHDQSGGDFQRMALAVVQYRHARLGSPQIIDWS